MPYVDRTVFTTNDQSSGEVADPNKLEANDSHIADVVDSNYTELVQFANGESITKFEIVNVKDFGAVGDGVTDDSQAFIDAVAHVVSLAKQEFDSGFYSYMPSLFIPAGRYLITQKSALTPKKNALRGFNIKGDGWHNTEIIYDYTPSSGEDSYLMLNGENNEWWANSYVTDLTIRGNGSNDFWGVKSRKGAPKANRFLRCGFFNLQNAVTIEYGTDNANADVFHFEQCRSNECNGWIFGINSNQNSQSMIHSFIDCDFANHHGQIIYVRSGGHVLVRGGSWVLGKTGRSFHIDAFEGSSLGASNVIFDVDGLKIEWQHSDDTDTYEDYAPLVYNRSRAIVTFNNCNFRGFENAVPYFNYYHFVRIEDIGKVIFNHCVLTEKFGVRIIPDGGTTYYGENAPTVKLMNCRLFSHVSDIVDVDVVSNGDGFKPNIAGEGNYMFNENEPVDVTMNTFYGMRNIQAKLHQYIFTQHPNTSTYGLPSSFSKTFNLPLGASVKRVNIVFLPGSNTNSHTVDVEWNGEILVSGTHAPSNGHKQVFSGDLYKIVDTEAKRTITVTGTGGAPNGIPGFIEVEYY